MAANFNKLKACIAQLDYKFDVIAISETWMNDNESEEFQLENYNACYISRQHRTNGGVALYNINKALKHKQLPNFSKSKLLVLKSPHCCINLSCTKY